MYNVFVLELNLHYNVELTISVCMTVIIYCQVVGSIAMINGTLEISRTHTVNLAALQLTSYGQIQLLKGAHMMFRNNTGR